MIYSKEVTIKQLMYNFKTDYRYYCFNLNAYNIHKTIEIRILPHFNDVTEAKEAITFVITTIEDILNQVLQEQIELDSNEILIDRKDTFDIPELSEIKVFEI